MKIRHEVVNGTTFGFLLQRRDTKMCMTKDRPDRKERRRRSVNGILQYHYFTPTKSVTTQTYGQTYDEGSTHSNNMSNVVRGVEWVLNKNIRRVYFLFSFTLSLYKCQY